MDISPAVETPRAGDPITAAWAANLAAAVNSAANPADSVGAVSSPFGKTSPAAIAPAMYGSADMPAPFDVRLVWNASTSANEAYVALFLNTVWLVDEWDGANHSSYPIPRSVESGSAAVDQNTRWAKLPGYVDGATNYVFIWYKFGGGAAGHAYDVVAQQNTTRPAWADDWRLPPFIVAEIVPGTPAYRNRYGLHQFHRGLVWNFIPFMRGAKGTYKQNFCKSVALDAIYDNSGNQRMFLGSQSTIHGSLNVAGASANAAFGIDSPTKFVYHGDIYAPTSITDLNGNTHTVLAKQ